MISNKWKIRKAEKEDANNLKNCMIMAYTEYLDRFDGNRLPPMDVDYEEEINSYPVWVAESELEIVGGLILMIEDNFITIANIAVRPDFQSNGLGRGLMEFAESEAKNRGYSETRLATHVLLTENVSYYLKLGWTEINRDETRVYMKKIIK